jgi:hypothetical protein
LEILPFGHLQSIKHGNITEKLVGGSMTPMRNLWLSKQITLIIFKLRLERVDHVIIKPKNFLIRAGFFVVKIVCCKEVVKKRVLVEELRHIYLKMIILVRKMFFENNLIV